MSNVSNVIRNAKSYFEHADVVIYLKWKQNQKRVNKVGSIINILFRC
jgi:hypothetical protein